MMRTFQPWEGERAQSENSQRVRVKGVKRDCCVSETESARVSSVRSKVRGHSSRTAYRVRKRHERCTVSLTSLLILPSLFEQGAVEGAKVGERESESRECDRCVLVTSPLSCPSLAVTDTLCFSRRL